MSIVSLESDKDSSMIRVYSDFSLIKDGDKRTESFRMNLEIYKKVKIWTKLCFQAWNSGLSRLGPIYAVMTINYHHWNWINHLNFDKKLLLSLFEFLIMIWREITFAKYGKLWILDRRRTSQYEQFWTVKLSSFSITGLAFWKHQSVWLIQYDSYDQTHAIDFSRKVHSFKK